MGKRLILKTVMICVGIFILIFSGVSYFVLNKYEFDTEKRIGVLIACYDINEGDIIDVNSIAYKTIKASSLNNYMVTDNSLAVGKKVTHKTLAGDYIRKYDLLPSQKWYRNDDRIIVIQVDVETRLANLIKKGSYVDISTALNKDLTGERQLVLAKVKVEDVLDENGVSVSSDIGSKKAFLKFILNQSEREKLNKAKAVGKLDFELYCDKTQKPPL